YAAEHGGEHHHQWDLQHPQGQPGAVDGDLGQINPDQKQQGIEPPGNVEQQAADRMLQPLPSPGEGAEQYQAEGDQALLERMPESTPAAQALRLRGSASVKRQQADEYHGAEGEGVD